MIDNSPNIPLPPVPTEPSSPTPATVTLVASIIRSILLLLSGFGLAWGSAISDSQIMVLASAVVALGMGIWSLVQKFSAKHADHVGSTISAARGIPLQPKA